MRSSIVLGAAVVVTGLYAAAKWFKLKDEIRFLVSKRLDRNAVRPERSALVLRQKFGDVPTLPVVPQTNHTHGGSAGNRTSGSATIELIARTLGSETWYYQRSSADYRNGNSGDRTYYWSKDFNGPPARFEPKKGAIVVMVDVDHYVDMNDFLARHFHAVILYTCQPTSVCRVDGEYSYTFLSDSKLKYEVAGGGGYEHKVWNYAGDSVKVTWGFQGLPIVTNIYQLERRYMDADHQIILLAPIARFWFQDAILADWCMEGRKVERYKVVQGDFTRMVLKTSSTRNTITGRVGAYSCAVVKSSVDDAIASVARTMKSGLGLPAVKAAMGEDRNGCEILFEFHKMKNVMKYLPTVNVVDDYVRSYQFFDDDFDPEVKPSMVSFMAPLVDGAFCPMISKSNEKRAVDARIVAQRNDRPLSKHIMKLVEEFCSKFWEAKLGVMDPLDEDYLKMKQNKPMQRKILDDAEYLEPDRRVKSFMKREAYQKCSDPRIISTINGVDKRDYSLFMYSLSKVLNEKPWYAFGKTPKQIAHRIAEICNDAKMVVNTDFSRMDGRVSQVLRYLEERLMMTGFRKCYHDEIIELMRSQHGLRGSTTCGVKYDSGLSRLSGSPETSAFNTIANAFVAFATYRAMGDSFGKWIDANGAWDRLGLYAGDDGVSSDIDPVRYAKWADKVGQLLEVEPVKRGDIGVKFLSRQYGPYVWFGDPNSVCDFKRVMSKFHVTVGMNRNITPVDKLRDKAFALCLSDHSSPVVGAFVTAVIEKGGNWKFENLNGTWLPQGTDVEVQYPNEADCWMDTLFAQQLAGFNRDAFEQWLRSANTLEDFLKPPQFVEKEEPKVPEGTDVVVDGDILSGLSITSDSEKPSKRVSHAKEKAKTERATVRPKPFSRTGKPRTVSDLLKRRRVNV